VRIARAKTEVERKDGERVRERREREREREGEREGRRERGKKRQRSVKESKALGEKVGRRAQRHPPSDQFQAQFHLASNWATGDGSPGENQPNDSNRREIDGLSPNPLQSNGSRIH